MDDKVVIDCIGPSVLTITISGAAHSVPIATDVIRINGPAGGTDHNLDSLPLIYDAAALSGRLNICDGAGKMVYCWRSSIMPQSMPSASTHGRAQRSSSASSEPVSRTEMTTPNSSLASAFSSRLGKCRSTNVRTGDTSRMSIESSTATLSRSGNFNNDMLDSQDGTSHDTLEVLSKEPIGPVNQELMIRFGKHYRELEQKCKVNEMKSKRTCAQCGEYPVETRITSCFHVYCNECLECLLNEAAANDLDLAHCAACDDEITEISSCQWLKEVGIDGFLRLGGWMTEYPGQGEDLASRKKAKTLEPKSPFTQTAARTGASSPPRAAKTAMQGRKYPRDHW